MGSRELSSVTVFTTMEGVSMTIRLLRRRGLVAFVAAILGTGILSPDTPAHAAATQSYLEAIACPSATTCFAAGQGDNNYGIIWSSTDGGQSWSPDSVPPVSRLDAMACPTPSVCYAGSIYGELVKTVDGGHVWSYATGSPIGLTTLVCITASICLGVGSDASGGDPVGATARTTDGGVTWSPPLTLSGTLSVDAAACATTLRCVAAGSAGIKNTGGGCIGCGPSTLLTSTDGGVTWSRGMVTAGTVESLACPASNDCLGVVDDEGRASPRYSMTTVATALDGTWRTVSVSQSLAFARGLACPTTTDCWTSTGSSIDRTADGGLSWSAIPWNNPRAICCGSGTTPAIACATPGDCIGAGSVWVAGGLEQARTFRFSSLPQQGYWLVAADGTVYPFGNATNWGSPSIYPGTVGMAGVRAGSGYFSVQANGWPFNSGYVNPYPPPAHVNQPVVGIAVDPVAAPGSFNGPYPYPGSGYWEVASDGGLFSFGSAHFYGSMGAVPLTRPVVGMAANPQGGGYWMVASDGGIFAFGTAGFYGSTGAIRLNRPVVGMAATPDGRGYWLVASDGGVFTFGDAHFYGSLGDTPLAAPIVGVATVR
jgi:ribosomal protein L24E